MTSRGSNAKKALVKKPKAGSKKPRPATKLFELATALRGHRKKLKISQKQLALLSGVGVVFIYDLERGKETIRLDKLLPILEVLGLELKLSTGKKGLSINL